MSDAVKKALINVMVGLLLTVIPGSVVMYATNKVSQEKIRSLQVSDTKQNKRFDKVESELKDFKREVYKSNAFD